ncbi:hypothetical protein D9V41_00345 [Aeromicrobium phragmitis]|uniref:Uncharacterized protein n=1 Tax=Aeromicrobium phragmitis TaxID=2478914 RepID=A0A3L8PP39_9ACTN|nr:hypothetical protein [Aeromicrobium phragmitis]RLV57147.1 hypothetical protein D9V41_00345 [Aeromicrobium phragmitis]
MAEDRIQASVTDELESLDRVRRRVTAVGFLAIAIHAVIALPLLAQYVAEDGKNPEAVLMLVLTAFAGMLTAAVTRVILGRSPFSVLWLAVGLLPAAIGIYLTWWAPFTLH